MMEFKPRQRDVLIDKLPDVANLAAGAFCSLFIAEETAYDYLSRRVNRKARKH